MEEHFVVGWALSNPIGCISCEVSAGCLTKTHFILGTGNIQRMVVPDLCALGNLYYHYALALYFQGDFEKAAQLWKECLDRSLSDDERVGAMHWLYTSLARIGKVEQANQILKSLPKEMDVIEYGSYYDLIKLYRGDGESGGSSDALQDVGYRYGLARWAILQGDQERGVRILNEVANSPLNTAFAVMAAKLDVAAMNRESAPRH